MRSITSLGKVTLFVFSSALVAISSGNSLGLGVPLCDTGIALA